MALPAAWMPPAAMRRVHVHWTAGAYGVIAFERSKYHVLIEEDGNVVRGTIPIDANEGPIRGNYAAHTLNANTDAIGVSLDAMAGARESPFNAGDHPITEAQWESLIEVVASLCERYGIPVTPETVLSHAEVEKNLGIKQRNKWDVAILPFAPSLNTARKVGNKMRREVQAVVDGTRVVPSDEAVEEPQGKDAQPAPAPHSMELAGVVTASSLNFRNAPDGDKTGSLPRGTEVAILDEDGGWYQVRSPAGYVGYVSARYVALEDSRSKAGAVEHFETVAPPYMARLIEDVPAWGELDAAAAFGNFGHESEGLTDITEDSPRGDHAGGLGWAQWSHSRRTVFELWCRESGFEPSDPEANYGFFLHELRTTERNTIEEVAEAKGLEAKTIAFERSYERAGVKHDDRRLEWARRALAAYRAAEPVQPPKPAARPDPQPKPETPSQDAPVRDAAQSLKKGKPMSKWIPDRKVWAGGLFMVVAFAFIQALNIWAGTGISLEAAFPASIFLGKLAEYLLPPSVRDVVERLDDAVVEMASAMPGSRVSPAVGDAAHEAKEHATATLVARVNDLAREIQRRSGR